MKRGLIAWDKNEVRPAVFDARIDKVRRYLTDERLPALVVYSELWRSNQARFLCNYMPYFNRALLIIPVNEPPTLFCGLSPRVYSWIRSVTTLADVRSAGNFALPLFQLASERRWKRIGVLDPEQLPYDLHRAIHEGELEIANVSSASIVSVGDDATELSMRRKALAVARGVLEEELSRAAGLREHEFAGRLEGRLRNAGAEDLIILTSNGDHAPAPPGGGTVDENSSASLALEYRGHWIRLSRPHGSIEIRESCGQTFLRALRGDLEETAWLENLAGSYPYEAMQPSDLRLNSIFAMHIRTEIDGKRFFYGDTCHYGLSGPELL